MLKIKNVIDRAATVVAKNKAVATALASLLVVAGAVGAEDVPTWTNIFTALTTILSAVL